MATEKNITIEVSRRTPGKGLCRSLRTERRVPAVVYGPKVENTPLFLYEGDAARYAPLQFENTIFVLKSDDPKLNGVKVLKKSIDVHPVTRRPIHMDFYAVDMTKTVRVDIEVRFEGRPVGLQDGGIFNAVRRDVEIECLPAEIPEFFTCDISELALNQSLHVSDLKLPSNIKLITALDETLATLAPPQAEEVAPVVAAPVEGEAAAAAGAPGAPGATPAAGATPDAAAPAAAGDKGEKKGKKG